MRLDFLRGLRTGLLASIFAVLAFAPAAVMAHDHNHHEDDHHWHHDHDDGPRVRFNFQFGSPGYYGSQYGHPYYGHNWYGPRYGSRWVYGPSYYAYDEIPVYQQYNVTRIVEQPAVPAGPPPAQNWYLCEDTGYYYPHVTECASGWTVVPPTPPRRR